MDLVQVLESISLEELLQMMHEKAEEGSKDVCAFIRGIFQASQDGSDKSEKRRIETFKSALSILQLQEMSHNLSSEIVSFLLLNIDLFHTSSLMNLAEYFVKNTKSDNIFCSKWVEIFTQVLSCLSLRDTIVYQGSDTSGADLKNNILKALFASDVNPSCVVQLISVIKDIELSDQETKLVSESLLQFLPDIELSELPSFIYQLLLLSSKGQRQQIIQGVMSYFIKQDKRFCGKEEDSEELIGNQDEMLYRQTEGTVILMISVSARHDRNVGKEFLGILKKIQHKSELVLSPFTFATALSLSKIHSSKDEIFDSLKKSVTLSFQLKIKRKSALWIRNMIQSSPDILSLIKEAIRSSQFGWDHVCEGLVKFGFAALETFGPRYVAGNAVKYLSDEGCQLGSHILRDAFKSHRIVRKEILEEILNQIVTKSLKPVRHYIDIFSQIVRSDSLFLLETLPKIVEILDYIYLLPHKNAVDILQALSPIMRISMPLKDTLMLVLRKALFHRDIEARKVAVSGYLMILKKLNSIGKVTLSQSQTSMSSQASSASMISTQVRADVYVSNANLSSKTMCLEIMGLLRRVLMQQSTVRQLLYTGLYDVILHNKSLQDIILELLLRQFEKYYDSTGNDDVPLNFNLCFQEVKSTLIMDEPLAHLICLIHLILYETGDVCDEEEDDVNASKMLENFLQKLSKRLCDVDVVDLQVTNKDSDEEVSDLTNSTLVLNVYETMIEYTLMQIKGFDSEGCDALLKLYDKYNEIVEAVSSKKQKKPSKSKASNVLTPVHMTIRFFTTIMHGLFVDGTFKHQEGLNALRKNFNFVTFIVKSCNQKLLKLSETGISDGFSETMINSFNLMLKISNIYFRAYFEGFSFNFTSSEQEKLSITFADGLASIFTYISAFQSKNAGKFITELCSESSTVQALQFVLKSIQKAVMKLLTDTENDVNLKEIIPLFSVIKTVYNLFTDDFTDSTYKWLKQLCAQQIFQNAQISRAFISLCLTLGSQQPNVLTFLREIAFDLHFHLDDIDPEEKVKGNLKYKIITPEIARSIVPNLISSLESSLEETECVLNYMKFNVNISTEFSGLTSHNNSLLKLEQGVSVHISEIILILHEVVQTSVSPDYTSTSIFKLVTKFYKTLCMLTKYYLLRHTKSKSLELPSAFEKLVKLSHTKLTTFVYAFITHIQLLTEGKKKVKNSVAVSNAMREIKTVPSLIFAIESYEKDLIILSKKCSTNLVNHMKVSTARDFRINVAALSSPQNSQNSDGTVAETSENNGNMSNVHNADEDTDNNEAEDSNDVEDEVDKDVSNHNDTSTHNDNESSNISVSENDRRTNMSSNKNSNQSQRKNKTSNLSLSKHKASNSSLSKMKTSNPSLTKSKTGNMSLSKSRTLNLSLSRNKANLSLSKGNSGRDVELSVQNNVKEIEPNASDGNDKKGVKRKRLGVRAGSSKRGR